MRVLGSLFAVAAIFLSGIVVATTPASAAITYWYKPSHPMNPYYPRPLNQSNCTGAWGIRSSLNYPYFLTAGHCQSTNTVVYGTDGRFGGVANNHYVPGGVDTAIVAPDPNVDGLQEIPGVGRTVGKLSNEFLTTSGNGLAFQAPRTGRSYGVTHGGWELWINDKRVACATFQGQPGDSGAPVFIHFGDRVYAAGVLVGAVGSKVCFVTIDDLLADWNAWLPVFNAATGETELLGPSLGGPADKLPVRSSGTPVPLSAP